MSATQSSDIAHQHPDLAKRRQTPLPTTAEDAKRLLVEQRKQVLWIGGLPWEEEPDAIVARLAQMLPPVRRIEVLKFRTRKQGLKYPPGSKHRGCALLACQDLEQAQKVTDVLFGLEWSAGKRLVIGPAARYPSHWTEQDYVLEDDLVAQQLIEAKAEAKRAHMRRHYKRDRARFMASVADIISKLPPPGGSAVTQRYRPLIAASGAAADELNQWAASIDWGGMPAECQPGVLFKGADNLRQQERAERKRVQVASFALALKQLAPDAEAAHTTDASPQHGLWKNGSCRRLRVVDFGSGSGNLVLPLAVLFPAVDFVSIDMKVKPIELLNERAAAAGLDNVRGEVGTIESFKGSCNVVFALHACGNATDYALLQAVRCRAAFVVSPCCVGKLQFSANIADAQVAARQQRGLDTSAMDALRARAAARLSSAEAHASTSGESCAATSAVADRTASGVPQSSSLSYARDAATEQRMSLSHPRSRWMQNALENAEEFETLARAADYSHTEGHSYAEDAVVAKANLELDRALAAEQDGYRVALVKLLQPELTAKSDVIVGVPADRVGDEFAWPWTE